VPINRFFVKQVNTYVVYDRLTGTIVGTTIAQDAVVKRVLTPKGLKYDERMEPAEAKIPLGAEEIFHKELCRLHFATALDKTFDEKL